MNNIKNNKTNELLKLLDGIVFQYNSTTKLVHFGSINGEILCENCTREEFFKLLAQSTNLMKDDYSFNEVIELLDSTKTSNFKSIISIPKNDGCYIRFEIHRVESNESNNILVSLIDLDKQRELANLFDPLTGLLQRNAIQLEIKSELEKTKPTPFSIFILDVDNFKDINDSYGHMFGDLILVLIANTIKDFLKDAKVGRIGGDEFLIVCYETEYEKVWQILHDMCEKIRELSKTNSNNAHITVTVGCARYGIDGTDYDTLFVKSDKALYRGKRKGRNCFIIYNEELHKNITSEIFKNLEQAENKNASNNSLLISVFDLLTTKQNYSKCINDLIHLLGTFFLLDRVSLAVKFPDGENPYMFDEWSNPNYPKYANLIDKNIENFKYWKRHMNERGICQIHNISNIFHTDNEFNTLLKQQEVKSTLAFELSFDEETLGLIRFDMCSKKRFWQPNDINTLQIISKILAIYLYKMRENITLERKLYRDSLTGLDNYSQFLDTCNSKLLHRTIEYAVFYFNIEHFKYVNDVYGYTVGDHIIIQLANILKFVFQNTSDVIARSSADRFLVMTKFISIEDIEDKFTQVIEQVSNIAYKDTNLKHKLIIVSGVYVTEPDEKNISSAINKANLARKSNTSSGYPRYTLYDDNILETYRFEHQLEEHMFEALNNDEFLIYLQPKVNVKTNEIIGAEALSRWYYKFEKLLMPFQFIPLFEKNGFICELDFYVFKKVCQIQKKFENDGKVLLPISVNMSKAQKDLHKYVERVEAIRQEYNVSPQIIEIEITESMLSNNVDEIISIMEELHELGYKISMDDFGSGYSNLALLSVLDFDILKLDGNFCKEDFEGKDKVIISSIIEMAKKLNISLICERVETQQQAKNLEELGCQIVQGYLYDKPISIDEFDKKYMKFKD